MGLAFGGVVPGGIRIGSETPAGIAIGDVKVWPPVAAALHSYSIVSGINSDGTIIGYWDNNLGTIQTPTYITPNGSSALIRQTMIRNGLLRLVLWQGGLGTGDGNQFPTMVRLTYQGAESVWGGPSAAASYGQGIGRDYSLVSGTNPLTANGRMIAVELIY